MRKWFQSVTVLSAVVLSVALGATFYAIYLSHQSQIIYESVDFVSQKEYRNFARAPARWERMAHHVGRLKYQHDEDTIDQAYTAIDVVRLRLALLQKADFSKYEKYFNQYGRDEGALSPADLRDRFSRLWELVHGFENEVDTVDNGGNISPDLDGNLEKGSVLLQTIEASMAAYTLKILDVQVDSIDQFFDMNFTLFLISISTLLGLSAYALYASYQQYRLNIALRKADEASMAKDAFLANISHELRTPLNAIIGLSHLALDDDPKPAIRDKVNQIGRSGDLLLELVNDVLDISKIRAKKLTLMPISLDVTELVSDVENTARSLLRGKTRLAAHIDVETPCYVVCDGVRLQQVLNNLVSNACKFTRDGHVIIRVASERLESDEIKVTFSVEDSGIGIAADTQQTLFQPFTQVEGNRNRTYGGTGLGLSISQAIVKAMGSEIELESAVGKGARFFFSLTLPKGQAPSVEILQSLPIKTELQGVRVLLVEDNPINLKIARAMLEKQGCVVHCAEDGFLAVDKVSEIGAEALDVILMDIEMPGRDGHETSKILHETFKDCLPPVIALTAHAFDAERDRARAAGMLDFVTKPIKPLHLYEAIGRNIKT